MSALASEMKLIVVVVIAGKGYALVYQPFHRFPAMFNHETHRIVFAQASAGNMSVTDMVFGRIIIAQNGGYSTLRPGARGIQQLMFGQKCHFLSFSQAQRQGHTRQTAANNQNIVFFH